VVIGVGVGAEGEGFDPHAKLLKATATTANPRILRHTLKPSVLRLTSGHGGLLPGSYVASSPRVSKSDKSQKRTYRNESARCRDRTPSPADKSQAAWLSIGNAAMAANVFVTCKEYRERQGTSEDAPLMMEQLASREVSNSRDLA
jgi:hypothetical protein